MMFTYNRQLAYLSYFGLFCSLLIHIAEFKEYSNLTSWTVELLWIWFYKVTRLAGSKDYVYIFVGSNQLIKRFEWRIKKMYDQDFFVNVLWMCCMSILWVCCMSVSCECAVWVYCECIVWVYFVSVLCEYVEWVFYIVWVCSMSILCECVWLYYHIVYSSTFISDGYHWRCCYFRLILLVF